MLPIYLLTLRFPLSTITALSILLSQSYSQLRQSKLFFCIGSIIALLIYTLKSFVANKSVPIVGKLTLSVHLTRWSVYCLPQVHVSHRGPF
jgi:hypothetical protein